MINTPFFRVLFTAFSQDADIICRGAEGDKARIFYAVNDIKKEKLKELLSQALLFKEVHKEILNENILILDDRNIFEIGYLSDDKMTVANMLNLIITEAENKIETS